MSKQNKKLTLKTEYSVQSLDGTRIGYARIGQGPAAIVVPGALSTASDYAELASALASTFTVYVMERRGRGVSGPQGSNYSIDRECEDMQVLLQKTGAELVVGHSFGGLVALETARRNQSIKKVAVYEPGVSIDRSIPADWFPAYEQKLAEGKRFDAFIEFIRAMNPESAGKAPRWLQKLLLPIFMGRESLRKLLSLLEESLHEHQEVARLDNSYANYGEVRAGVLLMYGGKANTTGTDQTWKRLLAVFADAELKKFPELDHFGINEGKPEEVASVIRQYFLR